jgi:hemolysin III
MYKGERFNSISHLIGAVLALAGAVILITFAANSGNNYKIVSFSIYGVTLFLLYHSLRGKAKQIFKMLDHQAIYLLIAGTYTPFMLVGLKGAFGRWMFILIWGLAAIGMALDALPTKGARVVPVIIYLVMGWICIFALQPLIDALPPMSFRWLLIGGILYTSGVLFYVLDNWYPRCHGV